MDFAFRWATRAVVFAGGKVIADGTPEAVFRDAETLRRAHLRPPALLEIFGMLRARGLVPADAACPRSAAELEALLDSGRA